MEPIGGSEFKAGFRSQESRTTDWLHMFEVALSRQPTSKEIESSLSFLKAMRGESGANEWREFARAMFGFKEFIYIR